MPRPELEKPVAKTVPILGPPGGPQGTARRSRFWDREIQNRGRFAVPNLGPPGGAELRISKGFPRLDRLAVPILGPPGGPGFKLRRP